MQGCASQSGRTLALDVMSGDESPRSRIQAALRALNTFPNLHLILVGDKFFIESCLKKSSTHCTRLTLVHSSKTVPMDQKPSQALRTREGTSMWEALQLVAQGRADACVSAGNTGALMAMGSLSLKTFTGIDRPAIAGSIPSQQGSVLMLDMGANIDCTASQLHQFALMGSALVKAVKRLPNPKIGLLNIGVEENKGTQPIREASQLLRQDKRLNYIGYLEGHDIFTGQADVIVCDGFAGNVALKSGEGTARLIHKKMLDLFQKSLWRRCLAFFVLPLLREFSQSVDPVLYNGASLLGLRSTVIKSHGSANVEGFYQAICEAVKEVGTDVPGKLADSIEFATQKSPDPDAQQKD